MKNNNPDVDGDEELLDGEIYTDYDADDVDIKSGEVDVFTDLDLDSDIIDGDDVDVDKILEKPRTKKEKIQDLEKEAGD
jgi:hypothetical protein